MYIVFSFLHLLSLQSGRVFGVMNSLFVVVAHVESVASTRVSD